MIRAVIFDLDGVVVDTEPLWTKTDLKLLSKRGINRDEYERVRNRRMGRTQIDVAMLFKKEFNIKDRPEVLIKERIENLLEIYEKELKLRDGVLNFINDIRNSKIKIALATGSPINVIDFVMNKLSLRNYFDEFVSSDMVARGKPEPDTFLYCAKKLKIKPNECLVIEDSPNGILAAKEAGMTCIAFRHQFNKNLDLSMADLIIEGFEELSSNDVKRLADL